MKTRLKWIGGVAWESEHDSGHRVKIDGSPKIGGQNLGSRPMELVLSALCGCAAMDLMTILKKQRQNVQAASIEASASRAEAIPAVFETIDVTFCFQGEDLNLPRIEKAVALAMEKYCSVSHMLAPKVQITHHCRISNSMTNPTE